MNIQTSEFDSFRNMDCNCYIKDYRTMPRRIMSFAGSPFMMAQLHAQELPNAMELAKSGLFWTKIYDIVQCTYCGVRLGRWHKGMDATVEHHRNSPQCPYLKCKKEPNLQTWVAQKPDYRRRDIRLATYRNFPYEHLAVKLANYGFVYTGFEDLSKCVTCSLVLGSWAAAEPNKIWKVHKIYSPTCVFTRDSGDI